MNDKTIKTQSNSEVSADNAVKGSQHAASLYSPLTEKDHRIVYFLADDPTISKELRNRIESFGYETRLIDKGENSANAFELDLKCALVSDLSLSSCNTVNTARELSLPLIYLSPQDTILKRLESVRSGGKFFISYESDISDVVSIIDRATTPHLHQSYRVLIIDDDELLAALNNLVLKQAGMTTKVIHDPLDTLDHLDNFKPDLILMDIFMPQCSGTELARIIRQEERYAGIPIVFLSTESDRQEQMAAMEFGGDDFLSKPVTPERLVASVTIRAKRAVDANTVAKKLEAIAGELKAKTIELDNALISARSSEALKSKLIATMSHEVRSPINGMMGILERLIESPLNPSQKEQAEIVLSSTESLLRILNDTLDFSKLEAGKMILEKTDFSLEMVTREVQQLFHDTAIKKGVIINRSVDESIPATISGDPLRLKQILINLTNNAIKFTDKGNIHISVKRQNSADDLLLLRFEVKDSGSGMTPSQQEKIFKEYSQADESTSRTHGGTGLGLSICEKLVKMMNGEIGVRSHPGKGSTFWFTAEFRTRHPDDITGSSAPDQQDLVTNFEHSNSRALIADDNEVNIMVIVSCLKKLGITVETATNGDEAVKMAQQNSYHIIFMDCHMPVLDGYRATGKIRAYEQSNDRPHTPIIATTGNTFDSDIEKCLDAGMDDYLAKPIRSKSLMRVLKKWLDDEKQTD